MKLSNALKALVIGVVSLTLSLSQAYAVIPDTHSVLGELVASTEETSQNPQVDSDQPRAVEAVEDEVPSAEDLLQSQAFVPSDILGAESAALEDFDTRAQDELVLPETGHHFWTRRNVVLTTSILLTTGLVVGLLLLLAAGGGGGGGSSDSGGGGGAGFVGAGGGELPLAPPIIPRIGFESGPGSIPGPSVPHHPEPSTFLLLGLGLLIPLLRKREA